MSGQITFFNKNRLDLSFDTPVLTASEASEFVNFVRNRSLRSGWATTGSADANNTTFEVDLVDQNSIDTIILNGHNFKSYKIEKWNGSAYVDFTPAIDVTNNSAETTRHEFTDGLVSKFKITIRGTFTPDDDKYLAEVIATAKIGQLNGWPIIKNAKVSRARKSQTMLSGKSSIRESVGAFSCSLTVTSLRDAFDLTVLETIHDLNDGFLMWLSGGNEAQFSSVRKGYRLKDIPLMKCKSEWNPDWYKGIYSSGIAVNVDVVEVVD